MEKTTTKPRPWPEEVFWQGQRWFLDTKRSKPGQQYYRCDAYPPNVHLSITSDSAHLTIEITVHGNKHSIHFFDGDKPSEYMTRPEYGALIAGGGEGALLKSMQDLNLYDHAERRKITNECAQAIREQRAREEKEKEAQQKQYAAQKAAAKQQKLQGTPKEVLDEVAAEKARKNKLAQTEANLAKIEKKRAAEEAHKKQAQVFSKRKSNAGAFQAAVTEPLDATSQSVKRPDGTAQAVLMFSVNGVKTFVPLSACLNLKDADTKNKVLDTDPKSYYYLRYNGTIYVALKSKAKNNGKAVGPCEIIIVNIAFAAQAAGYAVCYQSSFYAVDVTKLHDSSDLAVAALKTAGKLGGKVVIFHLEGEGYVGLSACLPITDSRVAKKHGQLAARDAKRQLEESAKRARAWLDGLPTVFLDGEMIWIDNAHPHFILDGATWRCADDDELSAVYTKFRKRRLAKFKGADGLTWFVVDLASTEPAKDLVADDAENDQHSINMFVLAKSAVANLPVYVVYDQAQISLYSTVGEVPATATVAAVLKGSTADGYHYEVSASVNPAHAPILGIDDNETLAALIQSLLLPRTVRNGYGIVSNVVWVGWDAVGPTEVLR